MIDFGSSYGEANRPSADADPFRPPLASTLVSCLHCGREYESYQIQWREASDEPGREGGYWCCPVEGCNGIGFGFDILPVDPNYRDEHGGWGWIAADDYEDEDGAWDAEL